MEKSAATHSYTLDRGLRALAVLAEHPDGLTVSELADELETHRAGVYRLLGPLGDHRLIRRELDGRLCLGPGLITLAAAFSPRLYDVAEPVLQALADRLRATTALTVRDGDEAVVARVVPPRTQDMHLTYRQGMRHALQQGAPGHALLASGAATPGEPPQITETRARGYAISRGQLLPGATGVAVALPRRRHEPEAAISAVWIEGLSAPAVAQDVLAAAAEIAEALARP